MPCTPSADSASRTSSSLKGLMIAVMSFICRPSMVVRARTHLRALTLHQEPCRDAAKRLFLDSKGKLMVCAGQTARLARKFGAFGVDFAKLHIFWAGLEPLIYRIIFSRWRSPDPGGGRFGRRTLERT